ncbi:MAG TPA: hypothetical protein VLR52_05335 [Bacteroidales bacterium]|nr:hypothetical protein [Bacteroidales bacterium]
MNLKRFFLPFILIGVMILSSCGNAELQKDADATADAMCRSIGAANELRKANPMDTANIMVLQANLKKVTTEMTILNVEFKQKYGKKANDASFNKKFAKMLRKAMLTCPNLSKEDKEQFEKEVSE